MGSSYSPADTNTNKFIEHEASVLQKVNRAIQNYYERNLCEEDMRYLPKDILRSIKGIYLEEIWPILPNHLKNSKIVQKRLPCKEHYNTTTTQIDGPPPPKSQCVTCLAQEQKAMHCNE